MHCMQPPMSLQLLLKPPCGLLFCCGESTELKTGGCLCALAGYDPGPSGMGYPQMPLPQQHGSGQHSGMGNLGLAALGALGGAATGHMLGSHHGVRAGWLARVIPCKHAADDMCISLHAAFSLVESCTGQQKPCACMHRAIMERHLALMAMGTTTTTTGITAGTTESIAITMAAPVAITMAALVAITMASTSAGDLRVVGLALQPCSLCWT